MTAPRRHTPGMVADIRCYAFRRSRRNGGAPVRTYVRWRPHATPLYYARLVAEGPPADPDPYAPGPVELIEEVSWNEAELKRNSAPEGGA